MKKMLIIFICCIFCSSCSLWHFNGNIKITKLSNSTLENNNIDKYKTKLDIEKNFGKPSAIFSKNGYETYEYFYTYYGTRILNMIPIVAIFASAPSAKASLLYVSFDKEEKVIDFYTITKSGVYDEKNLKIYE